MVETPALRRHGIVRLDPCLWPSLLAVRNCPALTEWAREGRPTIVRRRQSGDAADEVSLGVPLPPALGKARLALTAPAAAIVACDHPPSLHAAAAAAPRAWQAKIAALTDAFPSIRCFGSLAWQHLTGLRYLTDRSDLDLLVECENAAAADAAAARLAAIERRGGPRLDGELIAPSGAAVQWREWLGDGGEVLAKSLDGAALLPRAAVFA